MLFSNSLWTTASLLQQEATTAKEVSAFDWELLTLYLGVWHFRYFLESQQFIAYTDHKPLTFCMSKTAKPWSSHQRRQLSYISEYTTDVRHVQGKDSSVADTLSRATIDNVQLGIDCSALAVAQQQDAEVHTYRTFTSSFQLEDISFGTQGVTLLCDVSTSHARPIIPAGWRHQIFDMIHGLSHPSVCTTRKLIASRFVWSGLQKQVEIWARQCILCQSSKIQTHIKASLKKFSVPQHHFDCSFWHSDPCHPTRDLSSLHTYGNQLPSC